MVRLAALLGLGALSTGAHAITVYSQQPLGQATATDSASAASYTGAAAYDTTTLVAPALPNPMPSTQYTVAMQSSNASVANLSIPHTGAFFGFSIEFSVINQLLGKNSTYINVPFLNLLANIVERAGRVHIRIGGNTQETATLIDSLDDGKIIEKDKTNTTGTTETPGLFFTTDVFYLMSNISSLVNTKWYMGIPLNDTTNLRLGIAELGNSIVGENMLAFQIGNEPDLYADHKKRPSTYTQWDYFGEYGVVVDVLKNTTNVPTVNNFIAPSIATGDWTPEMVWDTGFIPQYQDTFYALAVEHYPDANCFKFGVGSYRDPQTVFPNYLNHTAATAVIAPYLNSSNIAQAYGKPFLMFETNTASCGGFPGISDSFGAALWALDFGLYMANANFTHAMLHVGGQNVYYNPFTAPPTNQSSFHQWSIGPVYYSTLVVSEAFGSSNNSQIVDLNANDGSIWTPSYAIYDNGAPARLVLINFLTDPSGASNMQVTVSVPGAPSEVYVKYLLAPSVATKGNFTWGGQTFGGSFDSDGRLMGTLDIKTVQCDTSSSTCGITVPAPGAALVFLSKDALLSADNDPDSTLTFSTTAQTRTHNTATIAASALATMNGMNGQTREMGSTSKGSVSAAAARAGALPALVALVGGALGALFVAALAR